MSATKDRLKLNRARATQVEKVAQEHIKQNKTLPEAEQLTANEIKFMVHNQINPGNTNPYRQFLSKKKQADISFSINSGPDVNKYSKIHGEIYKSNPPKLLQSPKSNSAPIVNSPTATLPPSAGSTEVSQASDGELSSLIRQYETDPVQAISKINNLPAEQQLLVNQGIQAGTDNITRLKKNPEVTPFLPQIPSNTNSLHPLDADAARFEQSKNATLYNPKAVIKNKQNAELFRSKELQNAQESAFDLRNPGPLQISSLTKPVASIPSSQTSNAVPGFFAGAGIKPQSGANPLTGNIFGFGSNTVSDTNSDLYSSNGGTGTIADASRNQLGTGLGGYGFASQNPGGDQSSSSLFGDLFTNSAATNANKGIGDGNFGFGGAFNSLKSGAGFLGDNIEGIGKLFSGYGAYQQGKVARDAHKLNQEKFGLQKQQAQNNINLQHDSYARNVADKNRYLAGRLGLLPTTGGLQGQQDFLSQYAPKINKPNLLG